MRTQVVTEGVRGDTLAGVRVYFRPRVLTMLLLGFSSGLPFLLTGNTLGYWLRDEGTSLTAIGFLSWVGIAYSLKPFYAPVMDRSDAPLFGRLGRLRGWILAAQLLVCLGLIAMSVIGQKSGLTLLGASSLLVAFASSAQDIVLDAWRIEAASNTDCIGLLSYDYQFGNRGRRLELGTIWVSENLDCRSHTPSAGDRFLLDYGFLWPQYRVLQLHHGSRRFRPGLCRCGSGHLHVELDQHRLHSDAVRAVILDLCVAGKNSKRDVGSSGRISISSWPNPDGCVRRLLYWGGRRWGPRCNSLHRAGAVGETRGGQASGTIGLAIRAQLTKLGESRSDSSWGSGMAATAYNRRSSNCGPSWKKPSAESK